MHKKKKLPLISVLLLSYNHETFIEESIRSVFKLESKEYLLELRIIDDGSTDQTKVIINNLIDISPIPIYVTLKEHSGIEAISKNFNELISDAKGEYITFLASDDIFLENSFSKRLDLLKEDNELKCIYSNGVNVEKGVKGRNVVYGDMLKVLDLNDPVHVYKYLTSDMPALYIQALIIKSDFLREVGGFDEDLIADDWVLNIKIFKKLCENGGRYLFINEIDFLRNIHNTNTSNNFDHHSRRIIQVVEKYFLKKDKKALLSNLYWSYGRQFLKNNQFILGIFYLIKSQASSFDLIKRINKKIRMS